MRICVLGAGIAGIMTAFYVLERGHAVTLVDRQPGPALETSRSNAGLLTPSQALPWNEPGIVREVFKWLFEDHGALVVRPRLDPAMWAWLIRFALLAREVDHRKNALISLALAKLSIAEIDAIADRYGIAFDRTRRGIVTLVRQESDRGPALSAMARIHAIGEACRLIERDETLTLEPALGPISDRFVCALLTEGDGSGDIHKFCTAVTNVLAANGASLRFGATVCGLRAEHGRVTAAVLDEGEVTADAFVLATGSESRRLAQQLGFDLKLYPVQGCSVTVETAGWDRPPRLPVRDRKLKVAVTPFGDRIRVAGMAVLNSGSRELHDRYFARIRRALAEMFPTLPDKNPTVEWSGLRPMTPDGPPLLGPTPFANLWLNTGHGPLGWTMGCGSAKVVAALIEGEAPPVPMEAVHYDRYAFRNSP